MCVWARSGEVSAVTENANARLRTVGPVLLEVQEVASSERIGARSRAPMGAVEKLRLRDARQRAHADHQQHQCVEWSASVGPLERLRALRSSWPPRETY